MSQQRYDEQDRLTKMEIRMSSFEQSLLAITDKLTNGLLGQRETLNDHEKRLRYVERACTVGAVILVIVQSFVKV